MSRKKVFEKQLQLLFFGNIFGVRAAASGNIQLFLLAMEKWRETSMVFTNRIKNSSIL